MDFAVVNKLDKLDSRANQIHCCDLGYTLVEKVHAIVTKYRQIKAAWGVFLWFIMKLI